MKFKDHTASDQAAQSTISQFISLLLSPPSSSLTTTQNPHELLELNSPSHLQDLRPEELAGFTHFLSRDVTPADLPPPARDAVNQVRAGTAREALLAFRDSVR